MEEAKKEKKLPKIFETKFFKKLKSIKHFEIIVVGIALLIIVLIFISSYKPASNLFGSDNSLNQSQGTQNSSDGVLTNTEIKLTNLISSVSGAGTVTVMAMENADKEILSVVVVASGANSASVKLKILSIVKTATNLPAEKIEVFY